MCPILEYFSQVLSYRHNYLNSKINRGAFFARADAYVQKLEAFQNRVLKKLIPCPKNTPPATVRLFAGIMPMAARIEILKLRFLWKISHAGDKNMAFSLYNQKKNELHKTKVGFTHEVFTLCRKLNCLDVWLKLRKHKENPLTKIRKIVTSHYLKLDVLRCQSLTSIYTSLFLNPNPKVHKQYQLFPFLNQLGSFPDALGRRQFIFALLDNCSFVRECPKCSCLHKDTLQTRWTIALRL